MAASWCGLHDVEYLIVFGASYCQTNLVPILGTPQPAPTLQDPLGVPFPGITYNEPGRRSSFVRFLLLTDILQISQNWVGHLVRKKPGRKVLVWNYAVGGATTQGVSAQIQTRFVEDASKPFGTPKCFTHVMLQSAKSQPSGAGNTACAKALFAVFVGINDVCFDINVEDTVKKLFYDCVEPLYLYGARNFIIFDNPPRLRKSGPIVNPSPGFVRHHAKIDRWNIALQQDIDNFKSRHANTTMFRFPTHGLFTEIFDEPEKYGFTAFDVGRAQGGKIWMDGLHPTSRVHEIIADKLIEVLS